MRGERTMMMRGVSLARQKGGGDSGRLAEAAEQEIASVGRRRRNHGYTGAEEIEKREAPTQLVLHPRFVLSRSSVLQKS